MKLEPKMAIICRNNIEITVALQAIERAGILWPDGEKPTEDDEVKELNECKLCIYPPEENYSFICLRYSVSIDKDEDDDDFEWTYLEAADVLRNLIIAERKKKYAT